jgi:hypothetical protein
VVALPSGDWRRLFVTQGGDGIEFHRFTRGDEGGGERDDSEEASFGRSLVMWWYTRASCEKMDAGGRKK